MKKIFNQTVKNAMCRLFFLVCFLSVVNFHAFAAEDRLINIRPQPATPQGQEQFSPGSVILLPDGRRGIIETVLPDGNLRTDLGVILLPDGKLAANPEQKAEIIVPEEIPQIAAIPKAEEAPVTEEPQTLPSLLPGTVEEKAPAIAVKPEAPPAQSKTVSPEAEKDLTLAELIPLTTAKQDQPQTQSPKKPVIPEKPDKNVKTPEVKAKPAEVKTREPEKKSEKKPAPEAKKQQKPKTGQELHIPEEAIRTGKLDFLEGCWEGRRPEYYSKRIIRECFCFDANGGSGKRRIFDTQGARMCIGSSKASLSKSGVLSVTSQGAACDDGERWGQAEMVCKNSGSKSPCSWVFRDAQNGRQSYVIPFVKVDSCRR